MAESANPRKINTSAKRLSVAEKQEQALILRRSGATLADIAKALGYRHASGAAKAIDSAMKKTLQHNADELRQLELDRLDRMQLGLWTAATAGDTRAVTAVLRIMVRRAKLLGLDAPTKTSNEILLRSLAETAAAETGLDPQLVLAEAQRILAKATGQ